MNAHSQKSEEENKKIIHHLVERDLKAKYSKILAEKHGVHPERKSWTILKLHWIKMVAACVILFVSYFIIQQYLPNNSPKQFALQQIKQTTILGDPAAMRKDVLFSEQLRLDANYAFIHNQFDEAIRLYENIIRTGNSIPSDYFYLGVSYLKCTDPKPAQAIEVFEKIKSEVQMKEELDWFSALALILQGDEIEAKGILMEIVQKKGFKYKEAQKLLKEM